jgi:hypothetical protein
VTATHDGGDTFTNQNTQSLELLEAGTSSGDTFDLSSGGVSAGDTASIGSVGDNVEVRIIWTSANGGNTATVATGTAPS